MAAFLFSDLLLVARQQGGRDNKLLVAMEPVYLSNIIDVDYSRGNGE